ncbi:sulfite exporter TauE/SafE family protein [Belliella kenyensis]|uniref:Probable membrane transporter protein n=1 Tax=Belliella kenyensis TaxID=1472724 RepID=A0ABV8EQQ0_9BACT|nr:sulfite exporter TauE/SafE family protein [Belliella kenyensis]MCH7403403.1 sulfite exporter TauE/SafE family protein [Belliella kenyensis]MDN3601615.1 sulfite exporter TauE/SafE family protein [Belliella kenyensis]
MQLILILIGAFIVFILSTLTGGGASLLLMPLVAVVVGVKAVAPVMAISIGLSSTSKVAFFWRDIDWKLFAWLFPSTIIGSILGARLFASLSSDYLQILIGLLLVSTVVQFRKPKKSKFKIKAWHFAPMGLVVAFLSGLIGGVGPLMNSAYLNYGISKESLLGTRSANAIILHITKIISYAYFGYVTGEVLKYGILIGVTSMVAVYIGKIILSKMSDLFFRQIVVASMVLSGILMLWKNWDTVESLIYKI